MRKTTFYISSCLIFLFTGQALFSQNCNTSNHALHFDGANDFVAPASCPIDGTGDFSWEARVICSSTGNNVRRLISFGNNSPANRLELSERNGLITLVRQSVAGTLANITVSTVNIRDGAWHHIALTRSGNNLILYLDGVQQSLTNNTTLTFNFNLFYLGRPITFTNNSGWLGKVDEVRIWNTVRSAADIAASQNCKVPCNTAGMLVYYPFDQGIAEGANANITVLQDCNNQNNGALNGFALTGATSNWVCSDLNFVNQACGQVCPAAYTFVRDSCGKVTFTNTTPGTFSYVWDFGDGSATSTATNPAHTYSSTGNYTVCLSLNSQPPCSVCQTVQAINFSQPPVLNCPTSISVNCNEVLPPFTPPVTWSQCSSIGTRVVNCVRLDGQALTAPYPLGVTTVRCIAADNIGSDTCTYPVIAIDNQPPVIACNSSITYSLDNTGHATVNPTDVLTVVFDNCCPLFNLQYGINGNPNFTCSDACPSVPRQLVLNVTDCNGNISSCSFIAKAEDKINPVVTCPLSYSINVANNTCTAPLTQSGSATDNCGISAQSVSLSGATVSSSSSGNGVGLPLNIGITTVAYSATDFCGNATPCSFQVTVKDQTSPVLTNCPANITVLGDLMNGGAVVNWTPPVATDNCSAVTLQSNYPNGGFMDCGANPISVTYIATDQSGNTATCVFSITMVCNSGNGCTCSTSFNMSLSPAGTSTGQGAPISCGSSYNMPCPVDGKFFDVNYSFGCQGNCAPSNISWELKRLSDGVVVDGGSFASVTPIELDGSLMSAPGIYQLSIQGFCDQNPCSCVVNLVVNNCEPFTDVCGKAVVSCYSNGVPNGFVLGLIDVQDRSSATINQPWSPSMYKHPSWTLSNLGEIFGIAIDGNDNIYAAASIIYSGYSGGMSYTTFGPAGPGGIYKINPYTGAISNFVTTESSPSANTTGQTKIPNSGTGLGNLCYDKDHLQFFVTNFEDGKIYRIAAPGNFSPEGTVLSIFEPFPTDPGTASISALGKRPWGIGYYQNTIYFGNWSESINYSSGGDNAVYSVTLNGLSGDFNAGSMLTEFVATHFESNWSMPVSDIEFSENGKMLVAERSVYDYNNFDHNLNAHNSRILEYTGGYQNWTATPKTFYVGALGENANCAGGCDYGYGEPSATGARGECDAFVWGSGDALRFDAMYLYGFLGIPVAGNNHAANHPYTATTAADLAPLNSYMIDADGDLFTQDKTQLGDIDIFECGTCAIQAPCPANCITNSISISTGYDPGTNSVLSPGNSDPMWTTIAVPPSSTVVPPQPANVVGPYGSAWATLPGSAWISAVPYNNYAINNCSHNDCTCEPFIYERCFCLCEDGDVTFDFDFLSDDAGAVELWDADNGVLVSSLANNCGDVTYPWNFQQPATSVNTTLFLPSGRYCLRIKHWNSGSVAMGVNLDGTVSGLSLEKDSCCANPTGAIVVNKYHDMDCDGVRDFVSGYWTYIDPGLAGWEFTITDPNGAVVCSGLTDVNGQFSCPNLAPGNYTVTETPQAGWAPKTPAGGTATVSVTALGVTEISFGNCKIPVSNCDSISAQILRDTSKMGCCYILQVNNEKSGFFTGIKIKILDGADLTVPPGLGPQWNLLGYSSVNNTATFTPNYGPYIDKGYSNVSFFCLNDVIAPHQTVLIQYLNSQGIVCQDTLHLSCNNCVQAAVDSVYCQNWNQPSMDVCINIGDGLNWTVGSAQLLPIGTGFGFTKSCFSLPDLAPGSTACGLHTGIYGALPGDTICFRVIIHRDDVCLGKPDLVCCTGGDTVCVIVPDCSPCPQTGADADLMPMPGDSCCWRITLVTPADNFFQGVYTEMLTDGLEFTTVDNFIGSGWNTLFLAPDKIYWDAIAPQGNYLQNFWQLPLVCVGEDGSGTAVPPVQDLLITWMGRDSSFCYDTLHLDCSFFDPPVCASVDSISLLCVQGTGEYTYTLNVGNFTNPPVSVSTIQITQVSGSAVLGQTYYPVALPYGGSTSITLPLSGNAGDDFCFLVTLQRTDNNGLPLDCCTSPDSTSYCIQLPTCPLPQQINAKLFPNPNPGQFTVSTDHPVPPGTVIRVMDILGREVYRQPLQSGPMQHSVSMDNFPTGMYFLEISSDNWSMWKQRVNISRQ